MGIALTDLGFVCSLGVTKEEIYQNLIQDRIPGLCYVTDDILNERVPFYAVSDQNISDMRCYHLLDLAVMQIKDSLLNLKKRIDSHQIGIVLGSSNTGIHEAQIDISRWIDTGICPSNFSFEKIELGSPALYLQKKLDINGPSYVISTACSSSAKAFQSARKMIKNGICQAVIVGGVDSRCMFAHNGFFSLDALSERPTIPFSSNRTGISLGEGAALFVMEKSDNGIQILGIGESTDAYDLTHPDPSGKGAIDCMKMALKDAKISSDKIDYINMHGTGTEANDNMEGKAIFNVFGSNVLCASTKPFTGHALGAAGAIELALSWIMLEKQFVIPHKYDGVFDQKIDKIKLANGSENIKLKRILSNSFAFGGSNVSIIIGKNNAE